MTLGEFLDCVPDCADRAVANFRDTAKLKFCDANGYLRILSIYTNRKRTKIYIDLEPKKERKSKP